MAFSINFDANTTKVVKSMTELRQELNGFKGALEKATDTQTIARLNRSIKETEASMKALKNISAAGFDDAIVKGSDRASQSLINFGRIAQDAPYALNNFGSVANNIDPLISSFQLLVKETGSVGTAFKTLGASMLGAGGIGLAISIITSAITIFQMSARGAKEEVEDLEKSFKDFTNTIKDVRQIQDEATGSNTGNISVVRELSRVIMDSNSSYTQQKRALEELQQINKAYFGDIKLGADNFSLLTSRVNDYANALIATARVKGLSDELSRLTTEQIKQDRALSELKLKYDQAQRAVDGYKNSTTVMVNGVDVTAGAIKGAETQLRIAEKAYVDQRDKVEKLGVSIALLNGDIQGAVGNQLKLADTTSKTTKEIDLLKQRISALKELQGLTGLDLSQRIELSQLEVRLLNRDQIKLGFTKTELQEAINAKIQELFPSEFTNFRIRSKFFIEPEFSVIQKPVVLSEGQVEDISKAIGLPDQITPPAMTINAPTSIKFDPFAEALGNAFGNVISTIGENIGKALADGDLTGALEATVKSIFQIMGDVIIQVGKQLIMASTLVKLFKQALNNLFGPGGEVAGLAAGVLLVTTGAIIKNASFPKLADGGILTQATMFQGGEAGKEAVIPLAKLPYMMQAADGGTGGGNTTIGLRIKGRELIAFIEREQKYASRLG